MASSRASSICALNDTLAGLPKSVGAAGLDGIDVVLLGFMSKL
jgi:hypothetical protein